MRHSGFGAGFGSCVDEEKRVWELVSMERETRRWDDEDKDVKEEEEERREKEGSREENIRGIHSAVAAAV